MCEPTSIMAGISMVVGAIGQRQQAKAQEAMLKNQAAIGRQKADDAINRGIIDENKSRRETQARIGAQKAIQGSQLVEMDSGSASDLTGDTAEFGEFDALTIRSNAQREAYFHNRGVENSEFEAKSVANKSKYDTAGSLLSAGAVVSKTWNSPDSVRNMKNPFKKSFGGFTQDNPYAS